MSGQVDMRLNVSNLKHVLQAAGRPDAEKSKSALQIAVIHHLMGTFQESTCVSVDKSLGPTQVAASVVLRPHVYTSPAQVDLRCNFIAVRVPGTGSSDCQQLKVFVLRSEDLEHDVLNTYICRHVQASAYDGHLLQPDDDCRTVVQDPDRIPRDLLRALVYARVDPSSYTQRCASWAIMRKFAFTATTSQEVVQLFSSADGEPKTPTDDTVVAALYVSV
jgi:hypothetical protein